MLLFFIGFMFVFIDYNITIGAASVNLIPDFIGFALVLIASRSYVQKSARFKIVGILSAILGAWGIVAFVLALCSVSLAPIPELITGILATVGALGLTYAFCEGVKEYESGFVKPFGAAQLASSWVLLCMGNLIYYFTLVFENMYLVCILLQLLSIVWFEYSVFSIYQNLKKRKKR